MHPLHDTTVLVVEDDRPVRMLLRVVLEAAGAHVLTAEDGAQALRLLALHPDVDVVCTDLDMPVLDGAALAEMLAEQRPSLPVVVCSASMVAADDASLLKLVRAVVRKPFVPVDLVQALRAAIDDNPFVAHGDREDSLPRAV